MLLLCGCDRQRSEQYHPLFLKANKLEHAGNYSAAVKYYKQLLNVYPKSPAGHKALAGIYDDQLLQYLKAIYHYDRYLEYAPQASDHDDMKKWRNAAQRKYYLKARREYNDPNDVQLLQRKNNAIRLSLQKSAIRQRQLIGYIKKVKIDIAAIRKQAEKFKNKTIDLEIKLERSEDNLQKVKQQLKKVDSDLEAVRTLNLKLIDTVSNYKTAEDGENDKNIELDKTKAATEAETSENAPDADTAKTELETETAKTADKLPAVKTPVKINAPAKQVVEKNVAKIAKQLYIVKSGDTLSRISRKFYGSSKHYRHIMNANKKLLKTAKDLKPGQQLTIPSLNDI